MNELVPIDVDLIRRLRLEGKVEVANQLLAAYHKNKEKNKQQVKKEIIRQYNQRPEVKERQREYMRKRYHIIKNKLQKTGDSQ